ncbi:V-type ATP synthase subunit D [Sinisalibacter aestuarii]|uniref:V-type ATP synthase subunit D n=1 Tax=Sinisalibacter aestuarii TaxID=2949426 RepID=A0ABQ5LWI1_9RHOB|nr:V-type ATP synthase subunit D [Sinisalibacter aestuarii]GKY88750.1 hypothetical protein STA1M1_26190 [Sinisalibacter aestuarii]
MVDVIPTRGAALSLAEDQRFLENGYEFLDEKRMLLASTLLEELAAWRAASAEYDAAMQTAVATLKSALGRHGFDSLALYPTGDGAADGLALTSRNFLGLGLLQPVMASWEPPKPMPAPDASDAAEACRSAFAALVPLAIRTALHRRNILRLIREYRATERRARALENVILPETVATLNAVTEYLDQSDQEEALRIRNART